MIYFIALAIGILLILYLLMPQSKKHHEYLKKSNFSSSDLSNDEDKQAVKLESLSDETLKQKLLRFFNNTYQQVDSLYSNLFADYEIANGFLRSSEAALSTAGIFSTYPHPSLSILGAFAVEFVITAVLMFGILALGDEHNGASRGPMNPLLIGILIAVIGGSLGPLTGFAMNPARDFGPKLFAYLAGWDYALTGAKEIPYFIIPILAPIAGACFGGWAYPKMIGAYLPTAGQGCTIPNQCDKDEDSKTAEA